MAIQRQDHLLSTSEKIIVNIMCFLCDTRKFTGTVQFTCHRYILCSCMSFVYVFVFCIGVDLLVLVILQSNQRKTQLMKICLGKLGPPCNQ